MCDPHHGTDEKAAQCRNCFASRANRLCRDTAPRIQRKSGWTRLEEEEKNSSFYIRQWRRRNSPENVISALG